MRQAVEILSAYLPIDRAHALARGEALPSRVQGTVLFADISGFTPLTEALARQFGVRRGAEELTRHLNNVYNTLVLEVHRHKGSVINFSGDALTCWFDEMDENRGARYEDSSLRAIACGLAMQNDMQAFSHVSLPSGNRINLTMKVAVASGPARRFVVGQPLIQLLDVMAGATLVRMAVAEHLAQPGEVICDEFSVAALKDNLEVKEWRTDEITSERFAVIGDLEMVVQFDNRRPIAPGTLTEDQIRPWLLPGVFERLCSGQGEFLTELRLAVALFVRFEGINYDGDEIAGDKLDAFIQRVQTVLAKYEGVLLALTTGDKGSYLHAAFGALMAHEDDARRAVYAALELQALPPQLSFIRALQIGITKGGMRAGAYGGMTRRTYDVMGDDVNLAARLMQAASPGEVLVSEALQHAVSEAFAWEALAPMLVRGKAQPILVYRLARQVTPQIGSVRSPVGNMVGRAAELEQLATKLEALERGQGSVCIIEGEAGIGKSRLVADLIERTHRAGIQCLSGGGDAIEKSAPYHAWRSIFTQLFELDVLSADLDTRRAKFAEVVSRLPLYLQERAPLLNVLLPFDRPDNELTAQMTGEVRADNTRELLLAVLQQAAEKSPILLILDDTHWLDSASWALALAVSKCTQTNSLLFVIVTRPLSEPWPDEYAHLRAQADTLWLLLQALPSADAVALICERLGIAALPDPIAALILEKAQGNPFFSEELAYSLRDSGIIVIGHGECHIAPGVDFTAVTMPDTVEGVITSRIDRLTLPQQLTLKVASVIGRVFTYRLLRDVHPVEADKSQLLDHLNILQHLDLTPLDTPDPDLSYIFKHIITQEVAYNLMTFAQRRELHEIVAKWYEIMYESDLTSYYAILAHHWSKTDNRVKAIEYLEKAGEQALTQYANQEAVRFLSEASRLAEEVQSPISALRRARWERQQSEAYLKLGRHAESREHGEKTLALLGHSLPSGSRVRVIRLFGQIMRELRRRIVPTNIGYSSRGRVDSPEEKASHLEAARSYFILGELSYYENDVIMGLALMFGIVDLLEADESSPELANAYAGLSVAASHVGQASLADMYGRLARDTVQRLDKLETEAFVWLVEALVNFRLGRWSQAYIPARQAGTLFERLGDRRRWEESMNYLGDIAWMEGQFAHWLELILKIASSARKRNDANSSLYALGDIATARLILGQTEDTLGAIETGFSLITQGSDPKFEMFLSARLVQAYLQLGETSKADQALERGKRVADEPSSTLVSAAASAALASAAIELWEARGHPPNEHKSLAKFIRRLHKTSRGDWRPVAQALLWRLRGWEAWLSGKPATAQRVWRKSLTVAERLKIPYEIGLSHYVLGKYGNTVKDRQLHLQKAAKIFEKLGAVVDLERAHRAREEE
jgi:class 3 adenylate cyclase/tetratricopeptide (TPR) repeat protein